MEKPKVQSVFRLFAFLRPYRLSLLAVTALILVVNVANALAPLLEGMITTRLLADYVDILNGEPGAGVNFSYIIKIIVWLLVCYGAGALGTFVYNFLMAEAVQNAVRDLRNRVEAKISRLPVRYFDSHPAGDVLSRITNDVDTISSALQQTLSQVINGVLVIVFAVVMMVRINWMMTAVMVAATLLSYFCARFIIGRSQPLFDGQQSALGAINGIVQEKYTGFAEIKLFSRQDEALEQFGAANRRLCDNTFRSQFYSGLITPLITFIMYLGVVTIIVMGAFYAMAGLIAVGQIQAFIRYVWQLYHPLSSVAQLSSAIQLAFASAGRVFEFLDEPEETPDPVSPQIIKEPAGSVRFSDVAFGYEPDKILLNDLSIDVKGGDMVAIVGPTGVGKTTMINLLMRFYDVLGGSIRIDGIDIREMRRRDLRSLFGMVLQDTWLFSGTVYENIRYGRFDSTEEEVVKAAETARVHHIIKTWPEGYNMVINEEGTNVSQGEKQLLTIARAILRDPVILILDEATSSVDTRLEFLLQKAMHSAMKGRTSFVIAHRLSTIRKADKILVMDGGRIAEQGSHEELMRLGGAYKRLYESQFQRSGV